MKLNRKIGWVACGVVTLAIVAGIGFWMRPVSYFQQMQYARETLSGIESYTTTVEGYRVRYSAEGPKSGPVVVLVHGLGGRSEDWLNLAPHLVKAGYRVYMPDLPGYGRSQRPADFSYSVRDEAGVVVGFLDALGLKQVDLGGWSMGGWIVQLVAAGHPERVRRLMIFDSVGLYARPTWDTKLFTPQTPAELEQLDALLMPHPPAVPQFIASDILRTSKKNAWVVSRALDAMMTGKDVTDNLLPELKMPVMVVWGDLDKITPLDLGEKMHALIPQSQIMVISGCGHLAPSQCADRIGPKLVEFLGTRE